MTNTILVETSARHVHLSEQDLATLFGAGATLTNKKDLSQPGQFACQECLDVIGPRSLGITAPVRESGDIAGSAGCKIIGPCGEIEISEGVIIAKRHIHLTPETAAERGVADKEVVCVKIATPDRSLIFDDVVVRVSPSFAPAMHIDTDESNAAGCGREVFGEIVK